MGDQNVKKFSKVLSERKEEIINKWKKTQMDEALMQLDILPEYELENFDKEFIENFSKLLSTDRPEDTSTEEWQNFKESFQGFISEKSKQGLSIQENLLLILTLKPLIFDSIKEVFGKDPDTCTRMVEILSSIFDNITVELANAHIKSREEIITRQEEEITELSTPVVRLWKGILAVPVIGTLDSARTQVVMETLLQRIVETESDIAIIDITGVPTVDTQVAQHIIKTINAARLMGAECIISGIRPQIAQTMVGLGVSFEVETKSSLADAFSLALKKLGYVITSEK